MADMASHNTIDLIVQAAYKYRLISKPGRTLFGRALIAANIAAVTEGNEQVVFQTPADYRFTAFPRKFKRDVVACAIHFYVTQAEQSPTWADSEEQRLVMKVAEKNAVKAGRRAVTEDEYDEDEEYVGQTVVTTAFTVHVESLMDEDEALPFGDITDEQRDPESDDYANSVMVRPIEVIQAERQAERDRVMEARSAAILADRQAAAAVESYTDDDDDDDYPEDGEDA